MVAFLSVIGVEAMNNEWFLTAPKDRKYAKEKTVSPSDLVHMVGPTLANSIAASTKSKKTKKKPLTDTGNTPYKWYTPPVAKTKPDIDWSLSRKNRARSAKESLRIRGIQDWYQPHSVMDCPPLISSSC